MLRCTNRFPVGSIQDIHNVLDAELNARFARSCTDAAFGYARAATAAYAAVANQTLEFWANAANPTSRGPAAAFDPWGITTRQAPKPAVALPFGNWPNPALEFFKMSNAWAANSPWGGSAWTASPWGAQGANGVAAQLAFSPVAAWWAMFPLNGNPASWPMAYSLMTAGVPSSVAWPTAEANTAALEAAEVATDALNAAFATYRSESGYAMTTVIAPRQLVAAMLLAPFGASLAFPWTMAYRASGL